MKISQTVSQKVYRRALISVLKTLLLAAISIAVLIYAEHSGGSNKTIAWGGGTTRTDFEPRYETRKNPKVLIRRRRAKTTDLLTLMDSKKLYLLGSVDECDEAPLEHRCQSIRVFNCTHLGPVDLLTTDTRNCTAEDDSARHVNKLYAVDCAQTITNFDCNVYRQTLLL